jgi:hypothetical protein
MMEYYEALKSKLDIFYKVKWNYLKDEVLGGKHKLQNNMYMMLPFVSKRLKGRK